MNIKLSKWMVYFFSSDGTREGNETIVANTREEAIRLYRLYFGIENSITCRAIPIIDCEVTSVNRR